jgi:hypothetical protein
MTVLHDIFELEYWGIFDRGIPNKERIVFKPRMRVQLTSFVILVGRKGPNGALQPYFDHAFLFPDVAVEPPTWVFVFTGPGTSVVSVEQYTQEPMQALYWGRTQTIFHDPNIIAAILRFDGILMPPPMNLQLRPLTSQPRLSGLGLSALEKK